jgi:hypothetical protein
MVFLIDLVPTDHAFGFKIGDQTISKEVFKAPDPDRKSSQELLDLDGLENDVVFHQHSEPSMIFALPIRLVLMHVPSVR